MGDTPARLRRMESRRLPGGVTVFVARTFGQRLLGLAGLARMPARSALLLPGCDSVHTAWMRMPIDVVFLDARGRVLGVRRSLRPWRLARYRGAEAVLECPAGGAGALLSVRFCRAAMRA